MEKFTDIHKLLKSVEGVILNKETLIDLNVPFSINILDKNFVASFKENDVTYESLDITINDEENDNKFCLSIPYDKLTFHEEQSIISINNFICESICITPEIETDNVFMLKNELTNHPTTLTKDLVLTSYIPHDTFFQKVREVKLAEKNITMDEKRNILIKDNRSVFAYQLNDNLESFKNFIKIS